MVKFAKTAMWSTLGLTLALGGCSKSSGDEGAAETTSEQKPQAAAEKSAAKVDMAAAKTVYEQTCAACHGAEGKGDGPGGANLTPKPRNFTDAEWQKSVTDEQLKKVILKGGMAVGKSPIMPPTPHLKEKPEALEGLVRLVRQFGK